MKKNILLLFAMLCSLAIGAQDNIQSAEPFEGEIEYETFENYSDYILKYPSSFYFNGVHKMRLILKGSKMHLIDETTKCHIVADADIAIAASKGNQAPAKAVTQKKSTGGSSLSNIISGSSSGSSSKSSAGKKDYVNGYVYYCDMTKTGIDLSKNVSLICQAVPWPLSYPNGDKLAVASYTFAKTDTTKNIGGQECTLYSGDANHAYDPKMDYHIKAYVSDIKAPSAYPWSIYGLQLPNIAMKWIMKYDGGHISLLGIGELSWYVEADVTKITPRKVSDDEFDIPSDYKISSKGGNALSIMKYFSGVEKQLKKAGIKGGDQSEKTTGVHYKTTGEWDF